MDDLEKEILKIEETARRQLGEKPDIVVSPGSVYRTHKTTPLLRRASKALKYSAMVFVLYYIFFPVRHNAILDGKVIAKEMRWIDAKVDGELVLLAKSNGDIIRKGEEIGWIYSLPLHQEKDRLEAEIKVLIAQLGGLKKDIEYENGLVLRYKRLFDTGDISRIRLDEEEMKCRDIEAAISVKEAEIQERTVRLSNIKKSLKGEVVRSPFDGIITSSISEKLKSQVKIGDRLCDVAYGGMQFEFRAKEDVLSSIQVGQKLTLKIEAFPGMRLEGRVDEIRPIVMEDMPKPWMKVYNARILVSVAKTLPEGVRFGMTATSKLLLKNRMSNVSKLFYEWKTRIKE